VRPSKDAIAAARARIERAVHAIDPQARVEFPSVGLGRLCTIAVGAGADGARVATAAVAAAGPAEAHAAHDGAADFIIVTDAHAGARPDDWRAPFFFLASNADFTRDAHTAGNRIAFDATRKVPGAGRGGLPVREYPPLVEMDAATAAMVDRRWNEYGFAGARVPTRGACP
jgi:hypothetical protein